MGKFIGRIEPGFCQEAVYENDRYGSFHPHQCSRKVWKDGYCRQHHPDTVKMRKEAATRKYNERVGQLERPYRLAEALRQIVNLPATATLVEAIELARKALD